MNTKNAGDVDDDGGGRVVVWDFLSKLVGMRRRPLVEIDKGADKQAHGVIELSAHAGERPKIEAGLLLVDDHLGFDFCRSGDLLNCCKGKSRPVLVA